ncbi:choice-of-anchor B family protein [Paracrocinitomix mangrovi]|uniref:choice-of-anchor B family protein n=1 Tax=Paracrocinitomix mangrovi TaxID=2862509 RepID=UPI001C8D3867|nr:choice-of-anchor B family protein [Paracrocinitomix mangrovi]UKN01832.1 choice-of-anchor B family protein [Paracrocinitomix mangrovi]
MKNLLLLALTAFTFNSFSQINMDSLGYMDIATMHSTDLNDIWGYTDELNNEYALVGTMDGTSIVDVTDPSNLVEIAWIPGMNSIWRDIKVYGDYAYVTTEASEGLLIIDLSPLPSSTTLPTTHYNGPMGNQWSSAHNLYQADGYVYIFGADRDNGGVIILDVATDPMNPIEVGSFEQWYVHDGFVRNDTGYFSHVNDGFFSIVDLTDKANVGVTDIIGTLATSNNFTHNCWPSDDGQTLFTTDEVSNGFIDSYDISNPANPIFLDNIQSSPGNNIIPHNSHVLNNYLVTSYYTDGVVIHDISDPNNMVEVGFYDTSPNYSGGTFNGCWGVYPFFASGNIIASDIEEGLYVLGFNPTPSCYLQGNVTNAGTGQPINNALIEILTTATTDNTDVLGDYSIGTTNTGMYQVRYSASGFYADTLDIDFVSGTILNENVALEQIPLFTATITVVDDQTSDPVAGASVLVEHTLQNFEGITDANGEVSFDLFYEDNYNITAGKWLRTNDCDAGVSLTIANNSHELQVGTGIQDDFTFDFGWTTFGSATAGHWVREVPVGAQASGEVANPFSDVIDDCSGFAYLTGNGSGTVGGDDVDGGSVELKSPIMDLSGYMNPEINFDYWFFNGFGSGGANDSLAIYISNGQGVIQVASLGLNNAVVSNWTNMSIKVTDYMAVTDLMQITFLATDFSPGHVMKAGVDDFYITELSGAGIAEFTQDIKIFPNPASESINISGIEKGTVKLLDMSGRVVKEETVQNSLDVSNVQTGMYVIVVYDQLGNPIFTQKQQIK